MPTADEMLTALPDAQEQQFRSRLQQAYTQATTPTGPFTNQQLATAWGKLTVEQKTRISNRIRELLR